ncbi:H-NS histone family protein [Sutterella sp.]|uniref:H-NS histone family protein n=1 Tax=Sutterella sp. TaxID=1981025 RepID=UPI0025F285C0|nr:H-NS histone family protein [uncultured Sutterella sp.]
MDFISPELEKELEDCNVLRTELAARESKLRDAVVVQVQQLINQMNINADELDFDDRPRARGRAAAAPKYRDPMSGQVWSGRGRKPKWFSERIAEGMTKDQLLISNQ